MIKYQSVLKQQMNQPKYNRGFVISLILNASFGTFFWMYTNTVFNSVSSYLRNYVFPDTSDAIFSFIASTPQLGAIPGSLLCGPISQKYGRRFTMILLNIIAIIGISLTLIENLPIMILGRFIQGIAFGGEFVITLMYCNEMSPLDIKGLAAAVTTLTYTLGIQTAFVLGFLMPIDADPERVQMWRVLFGVAFIPNILRLVLLLTLFRLETPFYLVSKKRDEEAKQILQQIYENENVVNGEIENLHREIEFLTTKATENEIKFRDLFSNKYRKCFAYCMYNALSIAFSGTNNILLFSNLMISNSDPGASAQTPVIFTTIIGNIDFVSCVFAVFVANIIKRKKGLLLGYLLVGGLNLSYGLIGLQNPYNPTLKYLLIIWPIIFEPLVGVMSTIYVSEASPDVLLSCIGVVNNAFGFLIAQFYIQISSKIGDAGFQGIQGIILLCGVFLTYWICVETKGKTKSQIIAEFSSIPIENEKKDDPSIEVEVEKAKEKKFSLKKNGAEMNPTPRSMQELLGDVKDGDQQPIETIGTLTNLQIDYALFVQ